MSARAEQRLPAEGLRTNHRDDVLAVHVLAARRDPPAPLAVRVLGQALATRGLSCSTGDLIELVNLALAAQTYAERVGLVETRVRSVDVRD